ncbi:hypothetical protein HK105_206132 [Polyrhizophydium stewartii]|uniref:Uncharacterized protein n=1 Tax=Polyrhizophydium stewartii TaxID=2732419 RepID=A0ABR4N4G1_9FUNG
MTQGTMLLDELRLAFSTVATDDSLGEDPDSGDGEFGSDGHGGPRATAPASTSGLGLGHGALGIGVGESDAAAASDDDDDDDESGWAYDYGEYSEYQALGAVKSATIVLIAAAAAASVAGLLWLAGRGCGPGGCGRDGALRRTVLLVSLDGFRADYLERGLTPNIKRIADGGVRAEYLKPSFPSVTFPNHYTLVTGLYPESHGVVGNVYFDPERNESFSYADPRKNGDGFWWDGGEPIWVTAERQGKVAATCMWPGSEAPIRGIRPTFWLRYNGSLTIDDKINHVLAWLDLPAKQRPSFLSLYIPEVDGAGHTGGPFSSEVAAALRFVDDAIGRLFEQLRHRGIADTINIVIVSDHGMEETSRDRVVFLDDYIDVAETFNFGNGPIWSIYPSGDVDTTFEQLSSGARKHGHFEVYRRAQMPEEFHFRLSPRIAPIILVPEIGWSVVESRVGYDSAHPPFPRGMHGYNNSDESMRALFVAHGGAFRQTLGETSVVPAFPNVELHQLLATLMGIRPAAHQNGTEDWLCAFSRKWLRPEFERCRSSGQGYIAE